MDGRLPTVPEYYSEHIDSTVDLITSPKQCCPFHDEDTPSFSYNIRTGRWSCFGKCHAHGDVIDMHRRYYHFSTRQEAQQDLRIRYHIPEETFETLVKKQEDYLISEEKVEDNAVYLQAVALADTPDKWLQLDYEMSKNPFNKNELQVLINQWSGKKSILDIEE